MMKQQVSRKEAEGDSTWTINPLDVGELVETCHLR